MRARVVEVETAKERVNARGMSLALRIVGRQTGSCVLLLAMTGKLSGFRGVHETAGQAQI
jgi:hypothetical protein